MSIAAGIPQAVHLEIECALKDATKIKPRKGEEIVVVTNFTPPMRFKSRSEVRQALKEHEKRKI